MLTLNANLDQSYAVSCCIDIWDTAILDVSPSRLNKLQSNKTHNQINVSQEKKNKNSLVWFKHQRTKTRGRIPSICRSLLYQPISPPWKTFPFGKLLHKLNQKESVGNIFQQPSWHTLGVVFTGSISGPSAKIPFCNLISVYGTSTCLMRKNTHKCRNV